MRSNAPSQMSLQDHRDHLYEVRKMLLWIRDQMRGLQGVDVHEKAAIDRIRARLEKDLFKS